MLFQTRKTFVHLRNTNEDIFNEIITISVPPLTAVQLPLWCFKKLIKRL